MTTVIPILSEVSPSAGNILVLHTNNIGEQSTGTVFCMNRGELDDRVSVALVANGNVSTSNCFICYRSLLNYGHSLYLQQICLDSQDSIEVTSENGTSTFIFTGQTIG
jgi:hypothetical protein